MTEEDSGSKPYQEQPTTPEDYADLVEIVSWVNQVATRNYPDITPLETGQVKIVPTIAEVEQKKAETTLHPFFLEKVGDKTQFSGLPAESWVSPDDDVVFFSQKCIDDMRKDKKVGYLGIGMDMVNAVVGLGAKPVRVESEKAKQMAIDMLTASYRTSLEGIVTEADLQEALAYMEEKGSYIEVRGLALAIIVEDKMFLPSTAMTSNLLFTTYLARPIKVDFGRVISDEFNLSPAQRGNIQSYAENVTSVDVSMTTKNPRQMERDLITSIDRMGFRGRNSLMKAYQAGDIGRKIIETH